MKDRVALFDDNVANLDLYESFLGHSYECAKFINPFSYEKALEFNPDIIIIDVMMPVMDGIELYKKVVNHKNYNGCPILFISASGSEEVLLKALKCGGQGFLSRSMSREEILYRIRNQVDYFKNNKIVYSLGEVKVDLKSLKAYENDVIIDLTLTEFKILRTLLTRYPQHITREQINEEIWPGLVVQANTLNTHLSNLRGKFSKWSYEIQHIKNFGIIISPKA